MRKSIFLLFLLLIACSPASTSTPTSTPIPPTTTATPPPTETLSPTPTPEGFQISPDGAVQVFENGKWVDLEAPEGIWGPVDGTNLVLVDDQEGDQDAVTQMKLDAGFVDGTDRDGFVNVAKYNEKTEAWEVIDLTITRSPEDWINIPPNYYQFEQATDRKINLVDVKAVLLGLKLEKDFDGGVAVTVLALYKNRIIKVSVGEWGIGDVRPGSFSLKSIDSKDVEVGDILQLLGIVQKHSSSKLLNTHFTIDWDTISINADIKDCGERKGYPSSEDFIAWCTKELSKGKDRKIPSKADVERILLFGSGNLKVDKDTKIIDPTDLWEMVGYLETLDGAWVRFGIQLNK